MHAFRCRFFTRVPVSRNLIQNSKALVPSSFLLLLVRHLLLEAMHLFLMSKYHGRDRQCFAAQASHPVAERPGDGREAKLDHSPLLMVWETWKTVT